MWEFCPSDESFEDQKLEDATPLPNGLVAGLSFSTLYVYKPCMPAQPWSLADEVDTHGWNNTNSPAVVRSWDLMDLLAAVIDPSTGYGEAREIVNLEMAGTTLS